MSAAMLASVMAILGALILVGSGLGRRGLGRRRLIRLGLIWAGIIILVWAAANISLHLRSDPKFT